MMADSPEGLVDGPVPAEEGAGSEEDEPEDWEAKTHAFGRHSDEVRQTRQQVEEQSHAVHWRHSRQEFNTTRHSFIQQKHLDYKRRKYDARNPDRALQPSSIHESSSAYPGWGILRGSPARWDI